MKSLLPRHLLAALALLAAFSSTASAAAPSYSAGDLLLGVRASGDPGSTTDYVLDLGPASQFTEAAGTFVVPGLGGVATDLATFSNAGGTPWSGRGDVFWSIVGTDAAGDPANTLYVTRPRSAPGTPSVPWGRRAEGTQSSTNSTFHAFIQGFTLSSTASSSRGALQSTSAANSYASFTSAGAAFNAFAGIEGNFGNNGTAGSVLDLYRLTPTTQTTAGAGLLYVGSFQFDASANLTFTPAPATFYFSSTAYPAQQSNGSVVLRVFRGGDVSGAETVQFDTADGSAVSGADYTSVTDATLTFNAGDTFKDVTITLANPLAPQPARTFTATLSNASQGALTAPLTTTVTIAAVGAPGVIAFGGASYSFAPVDENGQPNVLEIPLNRTNGSLGSVSVDVTLTGSGSLSAGTDFTPATSTITFADGVVTQNLTIHLGAIASAKLPRTINLSLGNPQGGATVGAQATASVSLAARDVVKPLFKVTSRGGGVTNGSYDLAGVAKDNVALERVDVHVNGGAVQHATLGAPSGGVVPFSLNGIALENGLNTVTVNAVDTSGNVAASQRLNIVYYHVRPALAGTYTGLVVPSGATASNDTSGLITVTVTSIGVFTGKVAIGAAVLPIRGLIDNAGNARFNVISDTVLAPTQFALALKVGRTTTAYGDLAFSLATGRVVGTVQDESAATVATLSADLPGFDGRTAGTSLPANYLVNGGRYTVAFPARLSETGLTTSGFPQGDGIATLLVNRAGVVVLAGLLADGTPISAAARVTANRQWPLFLRLYGGLGKLQGQVGFDDSQPDSDVAGSGLLWIRPAAVTAKYYPAGWPSGILSDLVGTKYSAAAGTSVLHGLKPDNFTTGNATLTLSDGKLTAAVTKAVNISATNRVTQTPVDRSYLLRLAPATGIFSGFFTHTDATRPAYYGIVLQKGANSSGYGVFLSTVPRGGPTGESGRALLQAD